jgi:hypothetical protein
MHRQRAALAVLIAGLLVVGCGDDGDSKKAGNAKPATQAAGDGANRAATKKKATKTSSRAKLVRCVEDAGFDVAPAGGDAEKATTYTVTGGEKSGRQAVIKIYPNRDDAERATARSGALNAVPFGRAVLTVYAGSARETGSIANCVSLAYRT